jgi:serine/threonine protein phosphatase PrpC
MAGPPPLRPFATSATAAYRAEGGRCEGLLVLGACVAGVSHRLARRRCEDCYAWAQLGPGQLALLVADGVGSAGRGGEGSEIALEAACHYLTQRARPTTDWSAAPGGPPPGGWGRQECLGAIAAANEALLQSGGAGAGELATTIVVALVCLEGGARSGGAVGAQAEVTLGRVGDSSAFTLSSEGAWQELFGSDGQTEKEPDESLIGSPPAVLPLEAPLGGRSPVELTKAQLSAGDALVLATDGVAEPLRDGPTTVAPRLAEVLALGPAGKLGPVDLALALSFSRRGAHDDRTLLVSWLVGN